MKGTICEIRADAFPSGRTIVVVPDHMIADYRKRGIILREYNPTLGERPLYEKLLTAIGDDPKLELFLAGLLSTAHRWGNEPPPEPAKPPAAAT